MSRFADMWKAYRAHTGDEPFQKTTWYMDNQDKLDFTDARIKVVGVWDTVGALVHIKWHSGYYVDTLTLHG